MSFYWIKTIDLPNYGNTQVIIKAFNKIDFNKIDFNKIDLKMENFLGLSGTEINAIIKETIIDCLQKDKIKILLEMISECDNNSSRLLVSPITEKFNKNEYMPNLIYLIIIKRYDKVIDLIESDNIDEDFLNYSGKNIFKFLFENICHDKKIM